MSTAGQLEIFTQRRVITFFQDALGYAYLGHWKDRPDNCYDEQAPPTGRPKGGGHSDNGELQNKKVHLQNKTGQNMSTAGQREIFTQRRVIAFFQDALMPTWRTARDELNRAPLAHEDWNY